MTLQAGLVKRAPARLIDDDLTAGRNLKQYRHYVLCMKKKGWRQKKSSQADFDRQNRLPLWPSAQQIKDEAELKSKERTLDLLTKENSYNQVIEDCNKALLLNPDDAESYSNRGVSLIMKANIDKEWNDRAAEDWGVNGNLLSHQVHQHGDLCSNPRLYCRLAIRCPKC